MAELQKEAKHHLNKTTNTIILDYLLWLASKTILEEAAQTDRGLAAGRPGDRSKGRRLVGLVDGLIMTFDLADRPKFRYGLLTRRIDLASLVILFVYRDARSRYITRRSSETRTGPGRREALRARTVRFLRDRGTSSVVDGRTLAGLQAIQVSDETRAQARSSFGVVVDERDSGRVSLQDALHRFFLVSASCYATQTPGPLWISIALEFCLFAALEGYLLADERGGDCVDACFSYGVLARRPDDDDEEEDDDRQVELDLLFSEAKGAEFANSWETGRRRTVDALRAREETRMDRHLLAVLQDHDFASFRDRVTTYLGAILESMADPELSKYPAVLDKSILRAPGMISIAHHETDVQVPPTTTTNTNGTRKRQKMTT
ncbi:protein of unknown function [Taphrina deformans PYCC 5710]|uniref:Uncharacterized protein n=1 Tax=Taphrina deformans (strain PYCC 5710 / ATCC 11124 / CBS 356.35 / IMI 108563 / JCM 9778 / NBRC 8474) TaxID=1097556 RepID=R4X9X1_TAPDE|nr:protein of unknown function [Taphrina deformans PYCC 5710]|eukprot:CCG82567.1 protein of unknown function [Taphrina deformans PYCC 5710]